MSSISISHPFPSSSQDQNQPFGFGFNDGHHSQDGSSSITFTMNPASSHPPRAGSISSLSKSRTPRTSIMGVSAPSTSSYVDNTMLNPNNGFDEGSILNEKDFEDDNLSRKETSKKASTSPSVRIQDVWREMFITSNGRDKGLKIIQYVIRMYLLFHTRTARLLQGVPAKAGASANGSKTTISTYGNLLLPKIILRTKLSNSGSGWDTDMLKGLNKAYSGLSLARKCMILFNWLGPLSTITAPQALTSDTKKKGKPKPLIHKLLHAPPPLLLELICGVSDDLATMYKLGLVPSRIGDPAEKMADWCWFAGTIVDLVEVGLERSVVGNAIREIESRLYSETMAGPGAISVVGQARDEVELAKLKREHGQLQLSRIKLLMDLIFVSYDVFHLKKYKEPVKAISGLVSAVLSTRKLYDKHHSKLARSVV